MNKPATHLEKIFAKSISDEGFLLRIHKSLSKLNTVIRKQPTKRMGKIFEEVFHQER